MKCKVTATGSGIRLWTSLGVHYSVNRLAVHITFLSHVLLEVLSGIRIQLPSLQLPCLVFLLVHIYIVVVEIDVQTIMEKVSEREAKVSLVTQWASPLLGQGCMVTISGREENPEH